MDGSLIVVERQQAAVGISVLVHGALVAYALARDPIVRPAGLAARDDIQIEVVEPVPVPAPASDAPIDVALVDDAAIAKLAPAPPATTRQRTRERIATTTEAATGVVVGPTTESTEVTPPAGALPGTKNRFFDMRGHQAPDLRLRPDALEHLPPGAQPAPEVAATGQLQPSGGGTYRSNQGVFTAKVEADGSVKLKDAKNLRFNFPDPRKIKKLPKAIGEGIASWYENDKIPWDGEDTALNNHRSAAKDTRPDHGDTASVPVMGGGFDLGDALMRKKGIDPYASKKLAYLDSTRDERVQIGSRYKQQQLAKAPQLVQKHLDRLWAQRPDTAALKQALFELWDDCAESGEPAVVEAGQAARKIVVGFIRAKLPAGSATAYTAAELAALNKQRQSKAAFAPYAG